MNDFVQSLAAFHTHAIQAGEIIKTEKMLVVRRGLSRVLNVIAFFQIRSTILDSPSYSTRSFD